MRKIIVGSMVVGSTVLVVPTQVMAVTPAEICSVPAEMAEAVMILRQKGLPMQEVIEAVEDARLTESRSTQPEWIEPLMNELVVEAYKDSRHSTVDMRKEAIAEFSSRVYRICYEAQKDKLAD